MPFGINSHARIRSGLAPLDKPKGRSMTYDTFFKIYFWIFEFADTNQDTTHMLSDACKEYLF
jgi:hypothetical protein